MPDYETEYGRRMKDLCVKEGHVATTRLGLAYAGCGYGQPNDGVRDAVLAALAESPGLMRDISKRTGYSMAMLRSAMGAMRRMGEVEAHQDKPSATATWSLRNPPQRGVSAPHAAEHEKGTQPEATEAVPLRQQAPVAPQAAGAQEAG